MNRALVSMESTIPCLRCGECCSAYQVRLTPVEARRIADELAMVWDDFVARYTDPRWPGTRSLLLRQEKGACVFLERSTEKQQTRCLIQPFKPASCLEWTPSLQQRECQAGLRKRWGLSVSPSGQLVGTEENRRRFQSFLEALHKTT